MKKVGIIGGGIIGLSSAYFLREAGCDVTVLDQGDFQSGCSYGNAGMVVPSHVIPLASPGMISKGIRWMMSAKSPFYLKPRLSGDLVKWGYHFYKHANAEHVKRSIPILKKISLFSQSIYKAWQKELPFDFGYQERGLLMLFHDAEIEKEEKETVQQLVKEGIDAHILSLPEIQKLEPDIKVRARGAVYYPGDSHLNPNALMSGLKKLLLDRGVVFKGGAGVKSFKINSQQVKVVKTDVGDFEFDEIVIAAGSWSGALAAKLGISLPIQAGKGYSFTLQEVNKNIRVPSIFLEPRVAVTPMGTSLRFGGTMEISGVDSKVNMRRVRGIVDAIPQYYPEMKVEMPELKNVWQGLRPCSPDGLPFIGRTRKYSNVLMATGHAMMGVSLGPGTGKLIEQLLMGGPLDLDIAPLDPERFN